VATTDWNCEWFAKVQLVVSERGKLSGLDEEWQG